MRQFVLCLIAMLSLASCASSRYSQVFTESEDKDIKRLTTRIEQCRDELLPQDPQQRETFDQAVNELASYHQPDFILRKQLNNILLAKQEIAAGGDLGYAAQESVATDHMIGSLSDGQINALLLNEELVQLIASGLLSAKPPYTVNLKSALFSELLLYKIEDGQRIADVGAGRGALSDILAILYDDLTLYVVEIDVNHYRYLKSRKAEIIQDTFRSQDFLPIWSETESTRLEGRHLDVVILRQVLHHASRPIDLLVSTRESISSTGHVYVLETPSDSKEARYTCQDALGEASARSLLQQSGFRIVSEQGLGKGVIGWRCGH